MTNYENIIHRVEDDSYVVSKNGMPYHVPKTEEYLTEWEAVNACAQANPQLVATEAEPPAPTPEELAAARIAEIDAEIRALEQKAIRPLLALRAGTGESYDEERLQELENTIIDLRCERQQLEVALTEPQNS
jgi:hypothetical protein